MKLVQLNQVIGKYTCMPSDRGLSTLNRTHLLILIGINALWGFNYLAGKEGTATFGPLLFITLSCFTESSLRDPYPLLP